MRKGIVVRAFAGDADPDRGARLLRGRDDFARCFEEARRAGFEGMQLYLDPTGYFSLESSDDIATAVAREARAAGLTITSLEIAPFSFLLTSDDPQARSHAHAVVERALQLAAAMGVDGVLAIPGYVGLPWDPTAPVVQYDQAYQRTRDGLASLAAGAERLGVSVLIENVWNMFLLSPLEMRALVDEIGSPRVRVLFDVGNVVLFGYPEQWIRILGSRIQEVHLKDFRRAVGTIDGFVGLLQGDVDWPAVMTALRGVGYDGFLTAEAFPYRCSPDVVVPQTSLAVDRILAM
jgi:L-ribulose-5-phosphate 3-epimerase